MALSENKIKGLQEHAHGADGPEKDIARRILAKNGIALKDPKAQPAGCAGFSGHRPPPRPKPNYQPGGSGFRGAYAGGAADSPFSDFFHGTGTDYTDLEDFVRRARGHGKREHAKTWEEKLREKLKEAADEADRKKSEETPGNYAIGDIDTLRKALFIASLAFKQHGPTKGLGVWDKEKSRYCFSKLNLSEIKTIKDQFHRNLKAFNDCIQQAIEIFFDPFLGGEFEP